MPTPRRRRQHEYLPSWFAARETGLADHKWMFKIVLAFEVRDNIGLPEGPWSLATCEEVENNLDKVKEELRWNRAWYICRLQDGKIAGPGYHHELTHSENSITNHIPYVSDLGHQMASSLVEITAKCMEEEPEVPCEAEEDEDEMSDSFISETSDPEQDSDTQDAGDEDINIGLDDLRM